jgi:mannose-1-phosphate guanylyltransferase/mannose-6-phosphate isomerase
VATLHNQKGDTSMFEGYDQVIVVSPRLAPLIKTAPTIAIYNGVRLPVLSGHNRQQLASEFGFDVNKPIFVAVGRLVLAKGFDILIAAAAKADVQILIVGDGELKETLSKQIVDTKAAVVLAGFRANVPELMAAADGLIISSRFEGGPYTLPEALLTHTPILSTDVGMVKEFMPAELIAPVEDIDALAAKLAWVSHHEQDWLRLMQSSFDKAQRLLTLEAMVAGRLVMFGIVPNYPETGYGYIRYGQQNGDVYAVDGFFEKPDLATAKQYLKANEFLWNSGMFLLRADVYLKELEKFNPQMLAACQKTVNNMVQDRDFMRLLPADFSDCPEDSIDYAVMEKTQFASVIPLEAGWSDVGSYSALWDIAQKDAHNNAVRGDVVLDDVNDCYIRAESRLVTALGVDNLVIVETEDALLVAAKDKVQNIKNIVAILRQQQRPHLKTPHRVYRPWGYYETIHQGERHQVKRIGVRPNASLSLQMHYHRAEHWVVVQGTAEVTCGERVFLVEENQSTYIPVGNKHRLRNLGKIWLEIIEVQSGSYLGEDDIVRFEDHYGRVPH